MLLRAAAEIVAVCAVLSIVFGFWLAWILINRRFPGSRELKALLTVALAVPAPLVSSSVLLNLAGAPFWGLAAGTFLSVAPVAVFGGRLAFSSIDPVYGKMARSLGASDWRAFWRVELPLVLRPVLATGGFAVLRIVAEVGIVFGTASRAGFLQ